MPPSDATSSLPDPDQVTGSGSLFSMIRPNERTYVLIDGSNTYNAAKMLGFSIDYGRLYQLFDANILLQRIYYFTALPSGEKPSWLRKQVDWMKHHGYTVIDKQVKEYPSSTGEGMFRKGNVDVEFAVTALTIADNVDHFVLMTGDGDFKSLVEALQMRGKRVTVISTTKSTQPMASDDLRKQTDFFIELADLRLAIERTWDRPQSDPDTLEGSDVTGPQTL